MKYLMMIKSAEKYRTETIPPELNEAMGAFVTEGFQAGWLKDTGGLKPSAHGHRLRLAGGKLKVIDGPFSEAKEVIGGYALVEVKSDEEAREIARRFMELHRVHWSAFECESEVRPLEE